LATWISTDVSVQKSKQSGFAWTIAHKNCPLWHGVGLAPGHEEDMYSGRAEAFLLLMGLTFLMHYLDSYGHNNFSASPLQCFCNNLGIITNVTKLLMPTILCPNNTTNDDRDIYEALCTLALKCSPLQSSFLHVKGHQDQNPNWPLTVIEQFNIDCDHQAKAYTQTTSKTSTTFGNPAIPKAQPHLYISNKLICQKLLMALKQAMAFPAYQKYLQQKLQWTK